MEILSIAAEKYKIALSQYHSYQDNVLDKPFLTADTIEKDNE
jgi:hypothetical protein